MKNLSLSIGVVALLTTPLAAAPTITHLQDIAVSGLETAPTGIVVTDAGTAYLAGANQRRVLKISDVITNNPGAPAVALYTASDDPVTAGPVTWPLYRGLFSAAYDSTTNTVLVAGDQGTDGMAILIDATTDTPTYQGTQVGGSDRRAAGAVFYGSNIVTTYTAGTNYWQFNNTLSALTGPGFYSGPTPSAARDMAVTAAGDILVSYNTKFVGDGLTAGIHRINDETTNPLSLTGNSNVSNWVSKAVTDSGSIQGISTFTYLVDSLEYAVWCLPESGEINIIDIATPSNVTVLTDATNLTFPRDAVVVTNGSSQYLVVSDADAGGATGGHVSVFGIDGATLINSVGDWFAY